MSSLFCQPCNSRRIRGSIRSSAVQSASHLNLAVSKLTEAPARARAQGKDSAPENFGFATNPEHYPGFPSPIGPPGEFYWNAKRQGFADQGAGPSRRFACEHNCRSLLAFQAFWPVQGLFAHAGCTHAIRTTLLAYCPHVTRGRPPSSRSGRNARKFLRRNPRGPATRHRFPFGQACDLM